MHPGEQREASAERIVPEEEIEHGVLVVATGPPVRIRHGELVQVGEQRGNPLPDTPLHNPAARAAAGRRCHVLPGLMPRLLGLAVLPPTPLPPEAETERGSWEIQPRLTLLH